MRLGRHFTPLSLTSALLNFLFITKNRVSTGNRFLYLLVFVITLLIVSEVSYASSSTVTFIVSPPSDHSGAIYITGSFEDWSGGSKPDYKAIRIDKGRYSISLTQPIGSKIEFKFTKGSWDKEELSEYGFSENRKFTFAKENQKVNVEIYSWRDFSGGSFQKNELAKSIDDYMRGAVKLGCSASVLIAQKDNIILSKGYGLANREENIGIDSNTIFDIGSITKQFTGAAILKLKEQGKLELNDTINHYFSDVPKDKSEITIHQLLIHTSGLVSHLGPDYEPISLAEYRSKLFQTKLLSPPGSVHRYSNTGYSLLAMIIDSVSGLEYEKYLEKYLFKPAGMKNTGYLIPDWKNKSIANGYLHSSGFLWGTSLKYWYKDGVTWHLKGNGGIFSNVNDMYLWHKALQNNVVLSSTSKVLFEAPHVKEGGNSYYAYGWSVLDTNRGTKHVTHNGGNGIFFADFHRFVDEDIVLIYMTNQAQDHLEYIPGIMNRMMFDANFSPKPAPCNTGEAPYNVVRKFMANHDSGEIDKLPVMYKRELGEPISKRILNRFGLYLARTPKDCDWSVALLELNTQLFPDDGNLYDSLGDTYLQCQNPDLASKSFKKALELSPEKDCFWCENAKKKLDSL